MKDGSIRHGISSSWPNHCGTVGACNTDCCSRLVNGASFQKGEAMTTTKQAEALHQMLAILVMDLGYKSQPVYGYTPLRHQVAWKMCADSMDAEQLKHMVQEMHEQAISEVTHE